MYMMLDDGRLMSDPRISRQAALVDHYRVMPTYGGNLEIALRNVQAEATRTAMGRG